MYILCIFLIFYFRIPLNHITIRHSIGNIKHGANKNLIERRNEIEPSTEETRSVDTKENTLSQSIDAASGYTASA